MNFGAKYATVQIDITTWEALEEAGCVFLPNTRNRTMTDDKPTIDETFGAHFAYTTATAASADKNKLIYFSLINYNLTTDNTNFRFLAVPVRLVQDL